jgi:hypothetical protein
MIGVDPHQMTTADWALLGALQVVWGAKIRCAPPRDGRFAGRTLVLAPHRVQQCRRADP